METALKIVAGILALPLGALGLRSLLAPKKMADAVGLSAIDHHGLSEIRSVLGGLLAGASALIVTGLVTDEPTWFLSVAVLMGVAIVGRLMSFATDGGDKTSFPPLIIEIVVAAVMISTAAAVG